ncbi:unnamed protein product [Ostreobium quekettii]|uniref:CRAL-TRIO domain-containing protein n=1 Tax=Ostreobium quekettii TaxID=121088 RepID=A0A8S1JH59_9CHLO|nr:unnamed protein product [Ostreobium quekettii]|eukprot:evm.model.scf_2067.1 EVM.evm.TU.scf_2067.1   scf_2067:2629-5624(+)
MGEEVRVSINLSSGGAHVQIAPKGPAPGIQPEDGAAGPGEDAGARAEGGETAEPGIADGGREGGGNDDGQQPTSNGDMAVKGEMSEREVSAGVVSGQIGERAGAGMPTVVSYPSEEVPVTRIELSSDHLSDADDASPRWAEGGGQLAVRTRGAAKPEGAGSPGGRIPDSARLSSEIDEDPGDALRSVTDALQEAEKRNSRRERSRSSSRSFNGSLDGAAGANGVSTPAPQGGGAPDGLAEIPLISQAGQPFEGLLHCDTTDSVGHPVVVVNTGALPRVPFGAARGRTAALNYIRDALQPVVERGPYVLIFTSLQVSSLSQVSAAWVVSAYRKLTRPFKKNVKFIVLVRPSLWLKALLKVMGMVVKQKARRKVKIVRFLEDMALATGGEVSMEHLGPSVLKALANAREAAAAAS